MELRPRRTRSKGPAARSDGGQGARRGQGVGAGEGRVADVQPGVGPPGHRLAQDVLGARRPERHHGAGAAGLPGQRDALGHGAAAVGVHLDADARAHQPAALEAQRLGQRDLLGQGRDRRGSPAALLTPSLCHRPGRAHGRPRHRPSAAPAGLRGSDAPTRRRGPVPSRSVCDDLGAADGDGVEGADGPHPVPVAGQAGRPGRRRVRLHQHGEVLAPPEAEGPGRRGVEGEAGRRDGGRPGPGRRAAGGPAAAR